MTSKARKTEKSFIEELLDCGSRRAAKAFDRYLTSRCYDLFDGKAGACPTCQRGDRSFKDCRVCHKKERRYSVLSDELIRRKMMTGREMLQFWVRVNKGNTAKRLYDLAVKAAEAAELRAAEKIEPKTEF